MKKLLIDDVVYVIAIVGSGLDPGRVPKFVFSMSLSWNLDYEFLLREITNVLSKFETGRFSNHVRFVYDRLSATLL